MPGTNTLAYFASSSAQKNLCNTDSRGQSHKLLVPSLSMQQNKLECLFGKVY
jgi:hypothetical protein